MLERQRVREDIRSRLVAAATLAGANVFASRATPVRASECPALMVYTIDQKGTGERASQHPIFETVLTVQVDAFVTKNDAWNDELDALCEEVENALLKSPDFVKEFERIESYNTSTQVRDGGEKRVATAVITLGLVYTEEFPPVVTDDMATTDVKVDAIDPADPNTGNPGQLGAPGPDGRDEAHVVIEHETEGA